MQLGSEVASWLADFDWQGALPRSAPRVADIGAKNFFLAPALDALFRERGFQPEIHGIEIDAYRRYPSLWTRADYGEHYAAKIERGHFHALDFLRWPLPLDAALLLNPFVTESPLLAWGLPRAHFKPAEIFAHAYHLLVPRKGVLLLGCPEEEELSRALELAKEAGFFPLERRNWFPKADSLQRRARLGVLLVTCPR